MINENNKPKPTLFLLEDNAKLAKDVTKLAQRIGYDVISARSLEEAQRHCESHSTTITVSLIDLMLPKTDEILGEVDDLLERRVKAGEKLTKRPRRGESDSEEKQRANDDMDGIDKQIRERIVDDAGIQFIQSDCGKKMLRRNGVTVAIFTARRADHVNGPQGGDGTLEAAVQNALEREPDVWFEKPVSPIDLEQWLEDLLQVS